MDKQLATDVKLQKISLFNKRNSTFVHCIWLHFVNVREILYICINNHVHYTLNRAFQYPQKCQK